MGGASILIVDDDRLIRMAVGAILEAEGYLVTEAADGASALEIIDSADAPRPNLVLLDVMMPGMNGREFLHTVRMQHDGYELPVIIMTALRGAMASQFLSLGANDFVYKPFDQEILLNKVALALIRAAKTEPPMLSQRNVVLSVDKNRQRQHQLDRLLTERGFTMVSVSESNEQLRRLARALSPRAIVLNLGGDEDSTLAAVRNLRAEPSLDAVAILATSPNRLEISALDAQATTEPLGDEELLAFIAQPPTTAARQNRAG